MSFDDPCTLHKEGPIITMQIMAGGGGGGGAAARTCNVLGKSGMHFQV